jgi:hypothetical protein
MLPEAYDWLFNKLEIADSQFDQSVVVLPAVIPRRTSRNIRPTVNRSRLFFSRA